MHFLTLTTTVVLLQIITAAPLQDVVEKPDPITNLRPICPNPPGIAGDCVPLPSPSLSKAVKVQLCVPQNRPAYPCARYEKPKDKARSRQHEPVERDPLRLNPADPRTRRRRNNTTAPPAATPSEDPPKASPRQNSADPPTESAVDSQSDKPLAVAAREANSPPKLADTNPHICWSSVNTCIPPRHERSDRVQRSQSPLASQEEDPAKPSADLEKRTPFRSNAVDFDAPCVSTDGGPSSADFPAPSKLPSAEPVVPEKGEPKPREKCFNAAGSPIACSAETHSKACPPGQGRIDGLCSYFPPETSPLKHLRYPSSRRPGDDGAHGPHPEGNEERKPERLVCPPGTPMIHEGCVIR